MNNLNSIRLIALLLISTVLIGGRPSFISAQDACDFSTVSGQVAGVWTLAADGIVEGATEHCGCCGANGAQPGRCGKELNSNFEMGDADIHVLQSGNVFSAYEGDVNSILFDLEGVIKGNSVTFIISGDGITPCIGGATTTYNGTINNNVITGSFSGYGQCCYVDPDGNPLCDIPTWTGTFTVTIKKIERCFGGIGVQCQGIPVFAEFSNDPDNCLVTGWMSVGSILHDRCCVATNNAGYSCSGLNQGNRRLCRREWQEAWDNTQCTALGAVRQWPHTWGPYPTGNTGDDTNADLRALVGSRVNPAYQGFCPSGKCQVNAKGKTIIKWDQCGRYCECQ